MSLASIKSKELKGKKNSLPKLRTILANPYKSKWDSLEALEVESFKELLRTNIDISGLNPRAFSTSYHVNIGLESVLRAINNSGISCVFISLKIKPRYIVDLIARNVQLKNPAAPIYALSNLEQLTCQIFGVSALAFSLPLETSTLDENLQEWIAKRKKTKSTEKSKSTATKIIAPKSNRMLSKDKQGVKTFSKIHMVAEKTSLSGDFISFNSSISTIEKDNLGLEEEKAKVLSVLSKMMPTEDRSGSLEKFRRNKANELSPSSNNFLMDYQPLEIHKIRANPNKNSKKDKRKKYNKSSKS